MRTSIFILIFLLGQHLFAQKHQTIRFGASNSLNLSIIWGKAFYYTETKDYSSMLKLCNLIKVSKDKKCLTNSYHFQEVEKYILSHEHQSLTASLTELIVFSILHDLILIMENPEISLSSKNIHALYAEVISMQFHIKKYDFALYQRLNTTIKRLYQSVRGNRQLTTNTHTSAFTNHPLFKRCTN